jgi:hypothetical protein
MKPHYENALNADDEASLQECSEGWWRSPTVGSRVLAMWLHQAVEREEESFEGLSERDNGTKYVSKWRSAQVSPLLALWVIYKEE